ncbi:hypothetical protein [Burkholderia sp. BCC0405]|uniref:hypothetical protein n=1 Tax=Burkholderia sp. BCC0405 TaxID=2676298 RepID=UPI00158AEEBE|nr:hypothetical protein [Burkholderia sp. BCC0405]
MAISFSVFAQFATQFSIQYASVVNSYGGCLWRNNGDGTSTIQVVINYRTITDNLGRRPDGSLRPDHVFNSRGILVYTYDARGNMRPSSDAAKYVVMNGTKNSNSYFGKGYVMYYGLNKDNAGLPGWNNRGAHSVIVEILIDNDVIRDWPGVAIRAGNFTQGDDVGEITGGAYVSGMGSNSACRVVDPEVPPPKPPPAIMIDVAAPDWNLGELARGEDEKTLAGAAQQLCFTYTGVDSYRNFVINATSENGILGNRYLLRNTSKPSQTVPYDMTLDSGSATFRLPNANASPVTLNNANRTCFVPTFRTSVDMTVDPGDYNDVLSFTIVTKS